MQKLTKNRADIGALGKPKTAILYERGSQNQSKINQRQLWPPTDTKSIQNWSWNLSEIVRNGCDRFLLGFLTDFATPSRTKSLFLVFQGHRCRRDFSLIFASIAHGGIWGRATPIEENGLFWFSNGIDLLIDRSKVNPKIYQQIDTTGKPKKAVFLDRGCSDEDSAIPNPSQN